MKKKLKTTELNDFILKLREKKINGINITIPFKQKVIPYLDNLSDEAKKTNSVNTIYVHKNKLFGHNTDVEGFELGMKDTKFNVTNKKVFILGAGGVVPSIIFVLKKMNVSKVMISNRTKDKAKNLKIFHKDLEIVEWGEVPNFDLIINATSLGLNKDDIINLDFSKISENKLFYDVIYNPSETNFLKSAKNLGHQTENGRKMFIYQAAAAFKIWHGLSPEINNEIIKILAE